ncbi:TIGR01777 family protein [Elizabethkingia meningoseptica]|uniref:TIGR01777 family oxidoreductase n=1 Tax=Elizabethkingia meningoseptica TaxID=238 RepID=UPI000936B4FE|nr:TIGR01777 family oxidoreductase [Elizabethkingia meningoseptica]MCL1676214.1 TIGR01777 family oxidoreductase [Elizabethkingia meningoseptica]MCL1684923.1 TIGR01777 family oxidoreductase [Elizabethkingia meningoseptica]MDE5489697.1 TIGR01777 family oxidoreductase [Elizabethkingia meningoseptica]MDE5491198.1 TIGR01777 family oxidoreductase [Elizabethkingia meningoseptica]MVW91436.1 TIGR01777 family protein [Elizabethkingia meningoseptica]
METVVITGGSGMIGNHLAQLLVEENYKVIHLSRSPDKHRESPNISFSFWNPATGEIDKKAIEQADYIVHLAGENIGKKKWTNSQKKKIEESRIQSSALLCKSLLETPNKIKAVISASGVNYYGADYDNRMTFDESVPKGKGFLADICEKWENSIKPVENMGKRLVIMRTGVVMSPKEGAFKEFLKPLSFRIAPTLGSGKQRMSWLHLDDITRAYVHAIKTESVNGTYNITAPHPISNHQAIIKIAKTKYRTIFIPVKVPAFILKMFMGEMAKETVLTSITTNSAKFTGTGFHFLFPIFNRDCIKDLLGK